MKNIEKHTNKKLKQLSDQHEVPFNESAWNRMDKMLDDQQEAPPPPPRRKLYFLTTIFTAMMILLCILFWWLLPLGDVSPSEQPTAQQQSQNTTEVIASTTKTTGDDVFKLNNNTSTTTTKNATSTTATTETKANTTTTNNSTNANTTLATTTNADVNSKNIYYTSTPPDTSLTNKLKSQLEQYHSFRAEEKVYVQFDKTFIKPGESIWMSAFVRDANTLQASTQSDIIYIEFLAPNGGIIKELKLVANNGVAKGDIQTTPEMVGGIYKVKAYTNWQKNFNEFFEKEITIQKAVIPHLRMKLDIEREAYGAGDEVIAKLNLKTLENEPLNNHAFEYDASLDGESITKLKGTTDEEGNAKLKFSLPKNLKTNNGLVNVMLQHNGQAESIARSIPIVLNTMDLQFFPEGGDLIEGMESKLGFKALNEYGQPADVEGIILNQNKTVVADFKSYHQGMGAVKFTPKKGERYLAVITKPKDIQGQFILPKALEKGYGLQVVKVGKDKLEVTIESTTDEPLTLLLQSQGKSYKTVSTFAKAGLHHLEIPIDNVPVGVAQLTLFDSKERPHAERLVFLNAHRTLDIQISMDKEQYLPREKVKMNIEVKDDKGNPVQGQFAVGIVDDKLLSFADDKQGNMLAYLLLESDLKGEIKEPNFYFEEKNKHPEKDQLLALDYLMMTNGWRRFTWKTNAKSIAGMIYPNERAVIGGVVVDEKGQPVEDAMVSVSGIYKTVITDKNGKFELLGVPLQTNRNNRQNFVQLLATKGTQGYIQTNQYGNNNKIVIQRPTPSPVLIEAIANAPRTIKGKVTDANGEELIGASIFLRGTTFGTTADLDGNFVIQNVPEGKYALEVTYTGFESSSKVIEINNEKGLLANVTLNEGGILDEVVVTGYKVPLIEMDNTTSGGGAITNEQVGRLPSRKIKRKRKKELTPVVISNDLEELEEYEAVIPTNDQIRNLPTRNVNAIAAQTAGLSSSDEGESISIKKTRPNATDYYIDGIRVQGTLPTDSEIEELAFITGGIPARFENAGDDFASSGNFTTFGWGSLDEKLKQTEGKVRTTKDDKIIVKNAQLGQAPLVMINGKQSSINYLYQLKNKNITSVSVLKNPEEIESYGQRGVNGVILVETDKDANNTSGINQEVLDYQNELIEKMDQQINFYHQKYTQSRRLIESGLVNLAEAQQLYQTLNLKAKQIAQIKNNANKLGRLSGSYPKIQFSPLHYTMVQDFQYATNFKKGFYTAREFYIPKYESTDVPEVRDDFRSTVFWNPTIETNEEGKASVEFYNSDDLTTFRATIEGMTPQGQLGRTTATYFTQLPFGMRTKLPTHVLTNDELVIPVTVSNNTNAKKRIEFTLDIPKGFEPLKQIPADFSLAANTTETFYFPFKVKSEQGEHRVAVMVKADGHQDIFSKKINVLSRGFPVHQVFGGNAMEEKFKVNISEPVEGSMEAAFTLHPSVLSDVSKGMERMVRQPTGCFEQTSSKNYPNVLVLDYLKSTNELDQNLGATLYDVLKKGYRRLLTFEVAGGGFDWYGKAPAHEGLTAYGLMQFKDMQGVYRVKQDVIDRTAKWLLSRKDGKGGWKTSKRVQGRWSGSNSVGDAYITWAMTEAGYGNKVKKELETSYKAARQQDDPYMMALMVLAMKNVQDNRAEQLVSRLLRMQKRNGSWTGLTKSMTHSTGNGLAIETTALTALAIMKTGKGIPQLNKAMEFIAASKNQYGFGSTQSTVLAMKALVEFTQFNEDEASSGWVQLFIDGNQVGEATYAKDQKQAIVFDDLGKHFTAGKHNVKILFKNAQKPLPYDLAILYNTTLPNNDEGCKVNLNTTLNNTSGKAGENIRLNVELKNTTNEAIPNTIAKIGIPSGLNVQHWQLKEMLDKEMFDYYEMMDGYLILHYRGMDANEVKNIPMDLKADLAGTFEAPASEAYLYYTNELKNWSKPKRVNIVTK